MDTDNARDAAAAAVAQLNKRPHFSQKAFCFLNFVCKAAVDGNLLTYLLTYFLTSLLTYVEREQR